RGQYIEPPAEWGWPELVSAADVMVEAADEICATEPLAWAMAAGLPIVGKAIRSVAELIAHSHNGLLSKTGEPAGLASVLLDIFDDPTRRRTLTDTARGQAYEVFSMREY